MYKRLAGSNLLVLIGLIWELKRFILVWGLKAPGFYNLRRHVKAPRNQYTVSITPNTVRERCAPEDVVIYTVCVCVLRCLFIVFCFPN